MRTKAIKHARSLALGGQHVSVLEIWPDGRTRVVWDTEHGHKAAKMAIDWRALEP